MALTPQLRRVVVWRSRHGATFPYAVCIRTKKFRIWRKYGGLIVVSAPLEAPAARASYDANVRELEDERRSLLQVEFGVYG